MKEIGRKDSRLARGGWDNKDHELKEYLKDMIRESLDTPFDKITITPVFYKGALYGSTQKYLPNQERINTYTFYYGDLECYLDLSGAATNNVDLDVICYQSRTYANVIKRTFDSNHSDGGLLQISAKNVFFSRALITYGVAGEDHTMYFNGYKIILHV